MPGVDLFQIGNQSMENIENIYKIPPEIDQLSKYLPFLLLNPRFLDITITEIHIIIDII